MNPVSKIFNGAYTIESPNGDHRTLQIKTQTRFYKLGYRLLEENSCVRCNRRLTDPVSISCGIGPECRKIVEIGVKIKRSGSVL